MQLTMTLYRSYYAPVSVGMGVRAVFAEHDGIKEQKSYSGFAVVIFYGGLFTGYRDYYGIAFMFQQFVMNSYKFLCSSATRMVFPGSVFFLRRVWSIAAFVSGYMAGR